MDEHNIKVGTILTPNKIGVKNINKTLNYRGSRNRIVHGQKMICVSDESYHVYMSLSAYAEQKHIKFNRLIYSPDAVCMLKYNFQEFENKPYLKPFAAVVGFFDWLGQQDETLKQCYVKRLKLWGVK